MPEKIKSSKLYKKAPIPFVGQKRNFVKHYINVLNEHIKGDGKGWTIVDAFGGSGLLSHVSKRIKPAANVIYNDFDHYTERLNHIDDTHKLRAELQSIVNTENKKKLNQHSKQKVIECIKKFKGYVDYKTLSTWLLFSGSFANSIKDLEKQTLYNRMTKKDYACHGYLDGLNIVSIDYAELLKTHINNNKCLFVLDPPYICTQQGMYANKNYFGMIEFLNLMSLVRPPFIFFSSTRSELIDYLEYVINHKQGNYKNFANYKRKSITAVCNHSTKYEDNLIYKFVLNR